MISVYVVDDHDIVRQGLRWLLESEPDIEVVGDSGSAVEAAARIPALRPDVAMLDTVLADGSGIQVCRSIRSLDPSIRCLIVTAFDDEEAFFSAVMAGASGYVLKTATCDDLANAVRAVAAGRSLIDPREMERVAERLHGAQARVGPLKRLSDQEIVVLRHMTEGLSNREIAASMHLTEKTAKNYVSNLLAKLGVERRTQAAVIGSRLLDDVPLPRGFTDEVPRTEPPPTRRGQGLTAPDR